MPGLTTAFLRRVPRIIRSVRFNILLGSAIVAAAALGSFIPQAPLSPEKVHALVHQYPQLSRIMDFLGLFNIYYSWWFTAMLVLLCFDIVVGRLVNPPVDPGTAVLPFKTSKPTAGSRFMPYRECLASALTPAAAIAAVRRLLKKSHYHLRPGSPATPEKAALVAIRHRPQRWGAHLTHASLIIILLGAVVKGIWGFEEMLPILEGGAEAMTNKPGWEVSVDKFTVEYFGGTRIPKEFASVMRVSRAGRVLGAKTLKVNSPLDVEGVKFYQSSWGMSRDFRGATLQSGEESLRISQGRSIKIPKTGMTVKADAFLPDFNIGPDGRAESRSNAMSNPAIRITMTKGDLRTKPLWLFQSDPLLCFMEERDGTLRTTAPPLLTLTAVDPVLFSGIQAAYDPGYKFILAGSILWLLGSVFLFYLHRRKLWVLAEPAGTGSRVWIAGWSSRGRGDFDKEFEDLMKRLRRKLETQGGAPLPRSSA